jgi:hypothetical protein
MVLEMGDPIPIPFLVGKIGYCTENSFALDLP